MPNNLHNENNNHNKNQSNEEVVIGIKNNISYTQELWRKAIHLCSLSFPLIYIFIDRPLMLTLLVPLLIIALIIDLLSKFNLKFREFYLKFFGAMLRPHEKNEKILLNGASWVLIAAVFVFATFPKIIAIISFTILIISDMLAALIGRRFGKHKLFDKSWEGTSAFIISGIIVVGIYWVALSAPITFLLFGAIGAAVAGFVEAASVTLKMDDNLSIPLSVGAVMWLGGFYSASIGLPYLELLVK